MDDLTTGESVAALTAIPGIGATRALALARALRTWAALDKASHAALAAITTDRLATVILDARSTIPREPSLPPGVRVLSLLDSNYPSALAAIPDPPPLLWVTGTLPPATCVAVVGTRTPPPFGIAVTRALVPALTGAGIGVISGLARGIDQEAAQAATRADAPSWAVLGHGLGQPLPGPRGDLAAALIARGGGLLSEVPPDVTVLPRLLMARNRIQSGLSAATVITATGVQAAEGDRPAGTMHTARAAIAQRRLLAVALPPEDERTEPSLAGNFALTDPAGIDPALLSATGALADTIRSRTPAADLVLTGTRDIPALIEHVRTGMITSEPSPHSEQASLF